MFRKYRISFLLSPCRIFFLLVELLLFILSSLSFFKEKISYTIPYTNLYITYNNIDCNDKHRNKYENNFNYDIKIFTLVNILYR